MSEFALPYVLREDDEDNDSSEFALPYVLREGDE